MFSEEKSRELCRILDLIDAEQQAAKADAKDHRERIEELIEEVKAVRIELEAGSQPTLFDEPESTMTALAEEEADEHVPFDDEQPPANLDPREARPGIDPYDQGASAKNAGRPETENPYHEGSYHWVSWCSGWNETAGLDNP